MRKMVVNVAAAAAFLLTCGLAWGETPAADKPKDAPPKSKLEEMLEQALRDNPDVRLAAAKLAEADAELNRARLQVVQKVAVLYQAVEAQKALVESVQADFEAAQTRFKAATGGPAELGEARAKLIAAKVKLAELEAEVPYLLGKQPQADEAKDRAAQEAYLRYTERAKVLWSRYDRDAAPVQGATADRIRAALDKPISLDFKDVTIKELIQELGSDRFHDVNSGLLFQVKDDAGASHVGPDPYDRKVTLHFKDVALGSILEWLEDALPNHRIVVRDYGLVIAPADKAPPGAPSLHDFWKGGKGDDKDKAKGDR
jgi:hypothetical protein